MFSKKLVDSASIPSDEFSDLKSALEWAAACVITYLDTQAPKVGLQKGGFSADDLFSIETRNDSPLMPLPYHRIFIKCNLLHDHFWKYFKEECKLPMTHLMRDIQIEEKDLRELQITQKQYSEFIGSFDDLINGRIKLVTVEKSDEFESDKPRMGI